MSDVPNLEESAAVASQPAAAPPEPAPPSGVVDAAAPAATTPAVETPAAGGETAADPAAQADGKPKLAESLLSEFDKKQAADPEAKKPATTTPEADAAAAPADPAAPAAPEPIAYEYTPPETLHLDDALKERVHSALDAFRADPTKGAQGLLELHANEMQRYAEGLLAKQYEVFNETRRGWVTEVLADPVLGGSGHNTAMGVIARMRDRFVSDADMPAFKQFLEVTGAGDHPQFLRLLHNVGRALDEPALPPPNPKPTPNNGQPPKKGMSSLYNK